MPWTIVLGSTVIAAIVSAIGGVLTRMLVDAKLEAVKSELNKSVEIVKSELSVWATFRNDTLQEMWKEDHGRVVKPAIEEYRRTIHSQVDLLSPDVVLTCQRFLDVSYEMMYGKRQPEDANPLKALRREFYENMARHFRLEELMPWMSTKPAS